ncbi:hypothetical protein C8Q76DRAFT_746600 [Earliella scabrosa]|nr:hypothetical protein C8Q76DRAFT_746600 [Earliella scabrosa]
MESLFIATPNISVSLTFLMFGPGIAYPNLLPPPKPSKSLTRQPSDISLPRWKTGTYSTGGLCRGTSMAAPSMKQRRKLPTRGCLFFHHHPARIRSAASVIPLTWEKEAILSSSQWLVFKPRHT